MSNFRLTESEKNRIRGLHNSTKHKYGTRIIKEDHFFFDASENEVSDDGHTKTTYKDKDSKYVMSNRDRAEYFNDKDRLVDFDETDYDEPKFYSDFSSFATDHPEASDYHFGMERGFGGEVIDKDAGERRFNLYKDKYGDLEYRGRKMS